MALVRFPRLKLETLSFDARMIKLFCLEMTLDQNNMVKVNMKLQFLLDSKNQLMERNLI